MRVNNVGIGTEDTSKMGMHTTLNLQNKNPMKYPKVE